MFGILTHIEKQKRKIIREYLRIRYPFVNFGQNLNCYGFPAFIFNIGAVVNWGNNLTFISENKYNMVGLFKRCTVFVDQSAKLTIGNNSGFSGVSIYCSKEITIGSNVNCGGNVCIWDTDFHPLDFESRRIHDTDKICTKSVFIDDDVFIGGNSIILKGVKIGKRAIIGAGSVITKDVQHDEIWAGNPAKFIRMNKEKI